MLSYSWVSQHRMQGDFMMCSEHLLTDSGVLGCLATCCLSCAALLQSHTRANFFGASLSSCWIKCCKCILTDESIRCHWWTLAVLRMPDAYVLCCACLCRDSKTNRVLCHHQPAESWPRVSAQFCNLQLFIEECGIKWIYDQTELEA